MQSDAKTVDEYFESLPDDRKDAMTRLRNVILDNIPPGFTEQMSYGMVGYVVPHSTYPADTTAIQNFLSPSSISHPKRILSLFIIWESMPIRQSWIGLQANILNIPVQNSTWERVVYGLKSRTRFLLN